MGCGFFNSSDRIRFSGFFPDDIEMRLTFTPANPRLALFSLEKNPDDKYYVEIDTAYLFIPSKCAVI